MYSTNLEFKEECVNGSDRVTKHALGIMLKRTHNQEVHTEQNVEITLFYCRTIRFSQLWVSPEGHWLLRSVYLGLRTDVSIVLGNIPCVISLLAPGLKNLIEQ